MFGPIGSKYAHNGAPLSAEWNNCGYLFSIRTVQSDCSANHGSVREALNALAAFLGFSHDPFVQASFPFSIVEQRPLHPLFQRHGDTANYELNLESALTTLTQAPQEDVDSQHAYNDFFSLAARYWPAERPMISYLCPAQYTKHGLTEAAEQAVELTGSSNPRLSLIGWYAATAMDLMTCQSECERSSLKIQLQCLHNLNHILQTVAAGQQEAFAEVISNLLRLQTSPFHTSAIRILLKADQGTFQGILLNLLPPNELTLKHAEVTVLAADILYQRDRTAGFALIQEGFAANILPNTPESTALMLLVPYIDQPVKHLDRLYRAAPNMKMQTVYAALDNILSKDPLPPQRTEGILFLNCDSPLRELLQHETRGISEGEYGAVCAAIETLEHTWQVAIPLSPTQLKALYLCAVHWEDDSRIKRWKSTLCQSRDSWTPTFCRQLLDAAHRMQKVDIEVAEAVAASLIGNPATSNLQRATAEVATSTAAILIAYSKNSMIPMMSAIMRNHDILDKSLWPLFMKRVANIYNPDTLQNLNDPFFEIRVDKAVIEAIGASFFQSPPDISAAEMDKCAEVIQIIAEGLPLCYCESYVNFCQTKLRPDVAESMIVSYFQSHVKKAKELTGSALTAYKDQLFDAQHEICALPPVQAECVFDTLSLAFASLDIPQTISYESAIIQKQFEADPQSAAKRIEQLIASPFRSRLDAGKEKPLSKLLKIHRSRAFSQRLNSILNALFQNPEHAPNHKMFYSDLRRLINEKSLTKEDLHVLLTRYACTLRPNLHAPDLRWKLVQCAMTAGYYEPSDRDIHYCHLNLLMNHAVPKLGSAADYEQLKKLIAELRTSFLPIPVHSTCLRKIKQQHNSSIVLFNLGREEQMPSAPTRQPARSASYARPAPLVRRAIGVQDNTKISSANT